MKTLLLAMVMMAVSFQAHAISRYNSESLTCGKAQSIVRTEGAVILRYTSKRTPGLPLFDRYVADDRYCDHNEEARLSPVPTRDTPSCPIARCEPGNWLFDD